MFLVGVWFLFMVVWVLGFVSYYFKWWSYGFLKFVWIYLVGMEGEEIDLVDWLENDFGLCLVWYLVMFW